MLALLLALTIPVTIQTTAPPDDPLGREFGLALATEFQPDADHPLTTGAKAVQIVVLVITTPVMVGQSYRATAVSIAVLKAGAVPVYLSGSVKVIPRAQLTQRARETSAEIRAPIRRTQRSRR